MPGRVADPDTPSRDLQSWPHLVRRLRSPWPASARPQRKPAARAWPDLRSQEILRPTKLTAFELGPGSADRRSAPHEPRHSPLVDGVDAFPKVRGLAQPGL